MFVVPGQLPRTVAIAPRQELEPTGPCLNKTISISVEQGYHVLQSLLKKSVVCFERALFRNSVFNGLSQIESRPVMLGWFFLFYHQVRGEVWQANCGEVRGESGEKNWGLICG